MIRRFHRSMPALAITAMLMLSLLPALGRYWVAYGPPAPQAAEHRGCHSSGQAAEREAPAAHPHADCAYCVLLAGTALPDTVPPGFLLRVAVVLRDDAARPVRVLDAPAHGLGARGPPSLG